MHMTYTYMYLIVDNHKSYKASGEQSSLCHTGERERERENRLVGLQSESSKHSDFPSRVVRKIHCYTVAFDSSF